MASDSPSKVAIYIRVSTQEQSFELQRRELETYAANRGLVIFKIYEDKATGTNGNRPAFKDLMSDVRAGKVDLVITWKLDRLFRSLRDLILTLQELTDLNVGFMSLKDQIDLSTSAGKLMLHIIGAFAQFEADLIRERVRAGIANARANGTRLGRRPFINRSLVANLRSQGWSLGKIAKHLNVSKTAVHKTLSLAQVTKGSTNVEIT